MAKNYYQKQRERLRKEACERYQNRSEEEKGRRLQKVRKRYEHFTEEEKEKRHSKNLSEEQNQKLVEHRRNYYLTNNK